MRRIAVTGATGTVGQFVTAELAAAGYDVVALARPESDVGPLRGVAEIRAFRLEPGGMSEKLLAGVDGLVHAAFQHIPGRFRGGEGDDLSGFIRANVDASLALMTAARRAGVKRCVVLSSRAVYGRQPPGVVLDEERPIHPDTHYGAVKAALEAFVSSFGLGERWPIAALRPTGIYGAVDPVARSKWFDLIVALLRGEEIPARGGTEVHGRDVAGAVLKLLTAPEDLIAGRLFNCSDFFLSARELAATVAEISGRTVPLPDPVEESAFNAMDSSALRALGVRFGGRELLHETLQALVQAAVRQEGTADPPDLGSRFRARRE